MFESVKSDYTKCKSMVARFYQHLIKTISQPNIIHNSFFDTLYKETIKSRKLLDNTNVCNLISTNIDDIIEDGLKDAMKEMKTDKRALKISKYLVENFDLTNFYELITDTKKLRNLIEYCYDNISDISSEKVKILNLFDNYFRR